jgi:hypothetical protein
MTPDAPATLESRLESALSGRRPAAAELEELLTDGFARVHALETRELRLERRCVAMVESGAPDDLATVVRERGRIGRELARLRSRLARLRTVEPLH